MLIRLVVMELCALGMMASAAAGVESYTDFFDWTGTKPVSAGEDYAELDEISGIDASRNHTGVYWVHNDDSSNGKTLYAFDITDGSIIREYDFTGLSGVLWTDTEDIAVDDTYVYIADTGENRSTEGLDAHRIYRWEETNTAPTTGDPISVSSDDVTVFIYTWPSGDACGPDPGSGATGNYHQTDCDIEAFFVNNGSFYFVTKRRATNAVYWIEDPSASTELAKICDLPQPDAAFDSITEAAISADGHWVVIGTDSGTDRESIWYIPTAGMDLDSDFWETEWQTFTVTGEPKGEAVCFDTETDVYEVTLYTVGEWEASSGRDDPIYKYVSSNEADCNSNGITDKADILGGTSADCNTNDTPDECDIEEETSADSNSNGIPDECEDPYVTYIRSVREHESGNAYSIEIDMGAQVETVEPRQSGSLVWLEVGFSEEVDASSFNAQTVQGKNTQVWLWRCNDIDANYYPTTISLDASGMFATLKFFKLDGEDPPNDEMYLIAVNGKLEDKDGSMLSGDRNAKMVLLHGDVEPAGGDGDVDSADRVAICEAFCDGVGESCSASGVCSNASASKVTDEENFIFDVMLTPYFINRGKINNADAAAPDASSGEFSVCR